MRNKLNLAITSLVLQVILFLAARLFPYAFIGSMVLGFASPLALLNLLCVLGMIPFFLSLYKNKAFAALLDENERPEVLHSKDRDWPKHLLIRVGALVGICLVLLVLSLLEGGQGSAYFIAYGVAYTLGIGALLLLAEAVILFIRKCPYKAFCNLALLAFALWVLYGMM